MKPTIPDDLLSHVAQQNSIAFVGAGLSAGLGLPSWAQLICQMVDWCEAHDISLPNKSDIEHILNVKKNFLAAADALRVQMGDDKRHLFLEEVFNRPDLTPTEVHKILAGIPFVGVCTTNYDLLVEEAYREVNPNESFNVLTQVDHEQLGRALNAKRYFVLKAHGTIERPETIVLDSRDYSRLIHRSEGYRTFLRAMFLHRTVLFLGFSMTDPELLLLLEELREIFDGHIPTHYALMDVSDTTQTEQEQLEENYGVKTIPYIPSAADHPEVKSFLTELREKVTQQAIWHQIEEARKAAKDDDPNYQVVFTTDGQFIIKERFPGAAEKHPLEFGVTITGRESIEAVERLKATGEPLEIKGEHIINVTLPDIITRYIAVTGHSRISTGVARGETKYLLKVTIECADGETASLDNIILEDIQSGNERAILSNENQDIPWKFRMVIQSGIVEKSVDYTFNDVGLPVKRALEGLLFSRALSKGGFLRFENVETGEQFAYADIPPNIMPTPEPLLVRILEALDVIQKKTGILFNSPQDVPEAMVKNIFDVEQIVKTGSVEFQPPYRHGATLEQAKEILERFSKDGVTTSLTQYADDWIFNVLGQSVSLGPVLVTCEKMNINPEDLEALSKSIETNPTDAVIEIRMTPTDDRKIDVNVPNWLSDEESEKIRNHPYAREIALKSIINLIFSAAHEEGFFDVEEFMNLLDDAKGQTNDQGIALNPLSTITTEEASTVIEPLIAELKDGEKLKLIMRLFNNGWLPSDEAARLAGLGERAFFDMSEA